MKTYQALFVVEVSVSIEVKAIDSDDAEEQFDMIAKENLESLLDRGVIKFQSASWDSSLKPIKKKATP